MRRSLRTRLGEALLEERIESSIEHELHQRRRRVVGAEVGAFAGERRKVGLATLDDPTGRSLSMFRDSKGVVEQRLVDGAKLLHAEAAVVDVKRHTAVELDGREGVHGLEHMPVGTVGSVQQWSTRRVEELTVVGVDTKKAGQFRAGEGPEGCLQALPEIRLSALDTSLLDQGTEMGERVRLVVKGRRSGQHPPLFGKQQEEHAVENAEQLAVELPAKPCLGSQPTTKFGLSLQHAIG